MFSVAVWSHHDNLGPKANNKLEGFHRKINGIVRKPHLKLFHIITTIKNLQFECGVYLKIFENSGRQRQKNTKYLNMQLTLMHLRNRCFESEMLPCTFIELCVGAIKLDE